MHRIHFYNILLFTLLTNSCYVSHQISARDLFRRNQETYACLTSSCLSFRNSRAILVLDRSPMQKNEKALTLSCALTSSLSIISKYLIKIILCEYRYCKLCKHFKWEFSYMLRLLLNYHDSLIIILQAIKYINYYIYVYLCTLGRSYIPLARI